ncbi:hypothetical protein [Streptomyces viridosporus]|uniref:hypothetical protein n=1 Tax=Streptomyces viridosporus TaxID=67581 RepID=UPI00331D766F
MTSWLRTRGATRAGVALRVGVALGAGVTLATGAVAMPYGSAVTPFGPPAAHAAEGPPGSDTGRGAHPVSRSPSPSSSASPFSPTPPAPPPPGEPSRAGSRAGEGRERPGRRETAEEAPRDTWQWKGHAPGEADGEGPDAGAGRPDAADVGGRPDAPREGDDGTAPRAPASQEAVPVSSAPPRTSAPDSVTSAERPAEPVLRILPLGSGLMLIGLGLGLAIIALRMRQGGGLS